MAVLGSFVVGLAVEIVLILYILVGKELGLVYEFNEIGDWAVYDTSNLDVFSQETVGVAALYSYGS